MRKNDEGGSGSCSVPVRQTRSSRRRRKAGDGNASHAPHDKCMFFMQRKSRYCGLERSSGSKYCGNHKPEEESVIRRVQCPYGNQYVHN